MNRTQSAAGLCLRLAALVSALFAAGHTYGTLAILQGASGADLQRQLVRVEGIARSYAELFAGYGFIITALLLMQSVVLWLAAGAHSRGQDMRAWVAVMASATAANALFALHFLIHIPLAFLLLILGLFLTSLALMRKTP